MSLAAIKQAMESEAPVNPIDGTTMDFLMNDLDDSVAAAEKEALGLNGEVEAEEDDGYKIETRDQAEYYTRRLVQAQRENAAVELAAKTRINEYRERVNAWKESKLKENAGDIERWTGLLRTWAEKELEGSKRKKSVKLIEGTLSFHKKDDYQFDDEKIIAYLQSQNREDLIRYAAPEVNKTALKKAYDLTTNKFPGVTYTVLPDTFSVK